MAVLIAGSAVRTCLGSGAETFEGLLRGACGVSPLRYGDPEKLNVAYGYHADLADEPFRAGRLLAECLKEAVAQSGVDTATQRVAVLVGTGLRELSAVERLALTGETVSADRLDFADVVAGALPGVTDVTTVVNACSAGGHVLALAQDLLELGECDAVVVAAADAMTRSMLAMVGRVAEEPTERVRPFDRDRTGVLLGEGAAVLVVVPGTWDGPALGKVTATGLSCDAYHATAPDIEGIARAMSDAYTRAGRIPSDVDVVVAHATGTALNDPVECNALRKVVLGGGGNPLVTAVKGATGHTSGSAALVNVDVALRIFASGEIPAVTGLSEPLDEATGLRLVIGEAVAARPELVQVNAFGFGGVNAVTLLERA
ncbi:beta-ketoacyl synthase N-terminal-like domain-containing protein [Amycolatopsis keratiniphila]|uniref:Beta-ketoacyl synthase n=1 Tax=Amycolatopsis keratiniphila TaxID=129921 RepID=R4TFS7_9PSEU|nr:beta-ketoacyl synthase N-terminal-like domain-containing protein [Amycolatopsis keratiniphila]AGM09188.1 beta-ketoacyl synthase [Amycolatopsis keratiniphila]